MEMQAAEAVVHTRDLEGAALFLAGLKPRPDHAAMRIGDGVLEVTVKEAGYGVWITVAVPAQTVTEDLGVARTVRASVISYAVEEASRGGHVTVSLDADGVLRFHTRVIDGADEIVPVPPRPMGPGDVFTGRLGAMVSSHGGWSLATDSGLDILVPEQTARRFSDLDVPARTLFSAQGSWWISGATRGQTEAGTLPVIAVVGAVHVY